MMFIEFLISMPVSSGISQPSLTTGAQGMLKRAFWRCIMEGMLRRFFLFDVYNLVIGSYSYVSNS